MRLLPLQKSIVYLSFAPKYGYWFLHIYNADNDNNKQFIWML